MRCLVTDYLRAYAGTVALDPVADISASKLTRAQAFDLLEPMRSRPVVARRLRQGLGAAWDHRLDAGRLPPETPNWWRLVLRGKLPSQGKRIGGAPVMQAKRVLNDAELTQLLAWLPNFSRDVQDVLTLYLWTLCRGAEIVAMAADEISRERDGLWWTVPRAKLKMRRNPMTVDLRVPLLGRARQVVERRLALARDSKAVWLFPSPGKAGHIQQKAIGVAVWWHMPYSGTRPGQARPRLPVTHWAPHDLRRTGRTMVAALGCPAEIGEALPGHLPPGVQAIYNRHGYDRERRQWRVQLDKRLEQLANAPAKKVKSEGGSR